MRYGSFSLRPGHHSDYNCESPEAKRITMPHRSVQSNCVGSNSSNILHKPFRSLGHVGGVHIVIL
jgi:hypothetical protein